MNETCQIDHLMLLWRGSGAQPWWPLDAAGSRPRASHFLLLPLPTPNTPSFPSWTVLSSFVGSGWDLRLKMLQLSLRILAWWVVSPWTLTMTSERNANVLDDGD